MNEMVDVKRQLAYLSSVIEGGRNLGGGAAAIRPSCDNYVKKKMESMVEFNELLIILEDDDSFNRYVRNLHY